VDINSNPNSVNMQKLNLEFNNLLTEDKIPNVKFKDHPFIKYYKHLTQAKNSFNVNELLSVKLRLLDISFIIQKDKYLDSTFEFFNEFDES